MTEKLMVTTKKKGRMNHLKASRCTLDLVIPFSSDIARWLFPKAAEVDTHWWKSWTSRCLRASDVSASWSDGDVSSAERKWSCPSDLEISCLPRSDSRGFHLETGHGNISHENIICHNIVNRCLNLNILVIQVFYVFFHEMILWFWIPKLS